MAKFYTYAMITVGLAVLFSITGVNTGFTWIMSVINGTNGILSLLVSGGIIFAALGALALLGNGIKIGFLNFSVTDLATTAGVGLVLIAFITDLYSVVTYAKAIDNNGWVYYIVLAVMMPVIGGFAISLYDWVRGAYN